MVYQRLSGLKSEFKYNLEGLVFHLRPNLYDLPASLMSLRRFKVSDVYFQDKECIESFLLGCIDLGTTVAGAFCQLASYGHYSKDLQRGLHIGTLLVELWAQRPRPIATIFVQPYFRRDTCDAYQRLTGVWFPRCFLHARMVFGRSSDMLNTLSLDLDGLYT